MLSSCLIVLHYVQMCESSRQTQTMPSLSINLGQVCQVVKFINNEYPTCYYKTASKPSLRVWVLVAPSLLIRTGGAAAAVLLLRLSADGAGAVQLEPGHDALLVINVITIQFTDLF